MRIESSFPADAVEMVAPAPWHVHKLHWAVMCSYDHCSAAGVGVVGVEGSHSQYSGSTNKWGSDT